MRKSLKGKRDGRYNKTHSNKEVKRYLGALQEHTEDRFKAIQEYLVEIPKKLDRQGYLLETHTEMIGNLAVKLEVMQESIELIRGDLKRKVDQDEFGALTRRVLVLERRVLK